MLEFDVRVLILLTVTLCPLHVSKYTSVLARVCANQALACLLKMDVRVDMMVVVVQQF